VIDSASDCGTNGWLVTAGGILTYGALALAAAALGKYLFFARRSSARFDLR
jgi:hypothetical protein